MSLGCGWNTSTWASAAVGCGCGYKGGKLRDIDLTKRARQALIEYLQQAKSKVDSPYVFPSQRSERLTEPGIRGVSQPESAGRERDEWELMKSLSYQVNVVTIFADRARENGLDTGGNGLSWTYR